MDILVEQDAGFGDIFFCQKIAVKLMEQGHTVYWPIYKEYEYVEKFIKNGVIWKVDTVEQAGAMRTLNLNQSTKYFSYPKGNVSENVMQAKYIYANKQFGTGTYENWKDYLNIERNFQEEEALENIVLKNAPEQFSLVCNHFATAYQDLKIPITSEYPTIEIRKIDGHNLFAWCGVIEKATEIRIPDSSYPYLVEILNTTDKLYMYSRNNEKGVMTKPIWIGKKWNFIDDHSFNPREQWEAIT